MIEPQKHISLTLMLTLTILPKIVLLFRFIGLLETILVLAFILSRSLVRIQKSRSRLLLFLTRRLPSSIIFAFPSIYDFLLWPTIAEMDEMLNDTRHMRGEWHNIDILVTDRHDGMLKSTVNRRRWEVTWYDFTEAQLDMNLDNTLVARDGWYGDA